MQQQAGSRAGEHAPKSAAMPYGGGATAQVFITPRLKRVMDVANEEAKQLKDEYISTEHIFLAIASERNTPSANILREASVTKERIYEADRGIAQWPARDRAERREQVSRAGEVRPRPDQGRARGQARPGDRPRCRNAARDAGALPPHQEQPGADRRGGRGQDRHRRRAGAEDRQRTMCRRP